MESCIIRPDLDAIGIFTDSIQKNIDKTGTMKKKTGTTAEGVEY